jgi:hypothetical protein
MNKHSEESYSSSKINMLDQKYKQELSKENIQVIKYKGRKCHL